ncbi:MAG TPA: hypothetical protein VK948_06575, partial [Aeromicrobium sp.]|nr:hypothetical protein [Aeromicrobium sp.]
LRPYRRLVTTIIPWERAEQEQPPADNPHVPHDGPEDHLVLDELTERLDSLRFLRANDPEAADAILESFGTHGVVEADIVQQLSTLDPIAHPSRFEEAHRRAMRAFEVYDRNGPRAGSVGHDVPRFLRGPAANVVRILVRMIVRQHQRTLAGEVRQLYALREASSAIGTPEHRMLTRSRRQVDAIRADLNKSPLPLPAFIGVGALLSATLSWIQRGLADELGRFLVLAAFAFLGLTGFWCVVRAAGIARRRTRISLDGPMTALWEVMGDAGALPRDKSRAFVAWATMVLVCVWLIVPVLVLLALEKV